MMKILHKYLYKEIALHTLGVTLVLMVVFLSQRFMLYVRALAQGKLLMSLLFHLMLLHVPYLLGLLLPFGLFLGILLAFGRLYADSEMLVLRTSGVDPYQLLRIILLPALVVAVFVASITLWFGPKLMFSRMQLLAQGRAAPIFETILPGKFQSSDDGRKIYYVERLSRDRRHVENLFVAEKKSQNDATKSRWAVTSAAAGHQAVDTRTGARYVVATKGYQYLGTPGHPDYRIVRFNEYSARIGSMPEAVTDKEETVSTKMLWKAPSSHLGYKAELQWRIAIPLSALLLAMLALPLSQLSPRQSKYTNLLPALLCYLVYVDLLLLGRGWIEQSLLFVNWGLWWIHGLMLMVSLILWCQSNDWRPRIWKRQAA